MAERILGGLSGGIVGVITGPVTKWVVLGFWLVMLVLMGPLTGKLGDVESHDNSDWLPANAESTKAIDELAKVQDPDDLTTTIVYHREGGLTKSDYTSIVLQIPEIAALDGVTSQQAGSRQARSPGESTVMPSIAYPTGEKKGQKQGLVSADGEVATVSLVVNYADDDATALLDLRDDLVEMTKIEGVDVYIGGSGGSTADQMEAGAGISGALLYAAAGVVIVILLITYRSPVLWFLPLVSVLVALVVSMGVVYLCAKYAGLTLNQMNRAILDVLVFGAGTDYALLLIARYREELARHEDRHRAMAVALRGSAPAIIASAGTVTVGMLGLMVATMGSTASLGPVCAIGIVAGLIVMLTLLPALLVITGRWVFWPVKPTYGATTAKTGRVWTRLGEWIRVRPRKVWIGTAAALLACCAGLSMLNITTLDSSETYTKDFPSLVGDRVLEEHDLGDPSSPIQVVSAPGTEKEVVAALTAAGYEGVTPVTDGSHEIALTAVPLSTDPMSKASFDAVEDVRSVVHDVDGADALATGTAAIQLDMASATDRDTKVVMPLVLGLVLIILMILLRSVLSPVLLMATVVLSFGAALGLSAVIFDAMGFAGQGREFPLFVFVFLVALGIDYNIFLMHRVREEVVEHGDTRRASLVALSATGGVITSAGIVLAATFAVLTTLPHVSFIEIGLAIALGVLLDTLVVRSILVTAINLDLGDVIWWPSRLARGQADAAVPAAPSFGPVRPSRPVRPVQEQLRQPPPMRGPRPPRDLRATPPQQWRPQQSPPQQWRPQGPRPHDVPPQDVPEIRRPRRPEGF
ncbi:RND superfamily putative drug exporter [Nocardioides luteus]|uniref:Membrane protein ActII-3 n=1 Tax=Nocardioides luteus TaxID=1844 RepID=A0ABQ5T2H4_9ACTN|nr:MMPL family transporter [Nocardioides luteus]MDR7309002.1 RND superfamily putative drug exporter [Nocardioides luteus]GGR71250.1 putative membrane protein ActII-3 [Nocardioides luteus]GLJ70692.1 putative membrane protein ActII-3 [Nocardioides luteus]